MRLKVCEACQIGGADTVRPLRAEAESIAKILGAILRNKKRNVQARDENTTALYRKSKRQ
jgi:hypothetical protein